MATSEKVTPERVKNLLSSFLVSSKQIDLEERQSGVRNSGIDENKKGTSPEKSEKSNLPRRKTEDPRNKEAFFKRLDTYTTFSWFAKPTDLSPLVCARYGWQIIGTDMLECVGCRAKLCGQLPKTRENYQEYCNKLKENLKTSHQKSCAWPSNPSPESFAKIPVYNTKEIVEDFHTRLKTMQTCSSQLPPLSYSSYLDQGIEEDKLNRSVHSVLEVTGEEIIDSSKTAVLLAVSGWKLRETKPLVLVCDYCQRNVGLWNYKQSVTEVQENKSEGNKDNISGDENNDSSCPVSKKMKMTEKETFDPLSEHRYWCAWVTDISQQKQYSPTSLNISFSVCTNDSVVDKEDNFIKQKPWVAVLRILCPSVFSEEIDVTISQQFKQNSPLAGLRHLRKMLREWETPKKVCKKQTTE